MGVNGLNAVQNGLNAVQNRLNAMQATLDANQAALHNICARAYNTEHATQPIHAIRPLVREANNPVGIIAAPGAGPLTSASLLRFFQRHLVPSTTLQTLISTGCAPSTKRTLASRHTRGSQTSIGLFWRGFGAKQ